MEIRGNPWKSVEIRGNPWKSVEIRGNPWESVEIRGLDSSYPHRQRPWLHGLVVAGEIDDEAVEPWALAVWVR